MSVLAPARRHPAPVGVRPRRTPDDGVADLVGATVWLLAESAVPRLAADLPPAEVLTTGELDRIGRLATSGARRRCLGARLMSRLLLARYAGTRPAALSFTTGRYGRPELSPNPWGLRFNLSHTEGLIACLVTRGAPCGVDVQGPLRPEALPYFRRALTDRELARLDAVEPGRRAAAVVDVWATKEAYTKALGAGLQYGFHRIEVHGVPDGPVAVHDPRLPVTRNRRWQFHLGHLNTGHTLAVAVRRPAPAPYPLSVRQLPEGVVR
ncbi:4'-phosphopantetheinyl transferase superfamily protein [Micromonospora sp. WMMD882]|uniref:4'-phosphopantetheinyl transferase family protein n=1 Tax=Micromonospora sp. WMMD882 TaxID=3015151 RepID=UPI00248CFCF1|nr:4'-phosphopantetheinyl transferase superfamily protein [Micromonospora sp. WMMD882]WBB78422.1 4'-phosphopantetheinyl transferase superfamily protein [Micromonospora sp. WMMD882]